MQITDIRIKLITNHHSLRGIASITIDGVLVIHDIRILDGSKGRFIAFPSVKLPEGEFKDVVHPIDLETRINIQNMILTAYDSILASNT